MGLFDKIKKINIFSGLTGNGFIEKEEEGTPLTDDFYDELEESLILADTGMDITLELVETLRKSVKNKKIKTIEGAREALWELVAEELSATELPRPEGEDNLDREILSDEVFDLSSKPSVLLFIGINGVGKTTSIGKIGAKLSQEGKNVLLCAGDTFRAAASEQLTIWADRSNLSIIKQQEGADPAAVVFDACTAAKARNSDVILVDTAGRLHNKQNLMNELNKISRVLERELPDSSRETLLVLDATTGQNGLIQAKQFQESAGITGIILTKLDGTAKGGIVIAIAKELKVPVKYVGVGEGIEDLQPFNGLEFAKALF